MLSPRPSTATSADEDRQTIRIADSPAQAGIAAALRRAFVMDAKEASAIDDQLNQLLARLH